MPTSPSGLKRARSERDSESLVPEKKPANETILKPSVLPILPLQNGLFKKSELKTTENYQKTLKKLEEKQKNEKKEPIVLRDPAKDYYPKGSSADLVNRTDDAKTAPVLGIFGRNLGRKVVEDKQEGSEKIIENVKKELETPELTDEKSSIEKKNPFAKALEKTSGGFGGFASNNGFVKIENGKDNAFKRLAGNTTSTWVVNNAAEDGKKKETKEVVTGEENEKNVLEVTTAKLFKFNKKSQSYDERGRGVLRMNDNGNGSDFSSRLVFRTAGTQRVALNTQIWSGMSVEQCTPKSIRISAQDTSNNDDSEVGIFLIQCGVEQSKQLFHALDYRILQVKQNEEK